MAFFPVTVSEEARGSRDVIELISILVRARALSDYIISKNEQQTPEQAKIHFGLDAAIPDAVWDSTLVDLNSALNVPAIDSFTSQLG